MPAHAIVGAQWGDEGKGKLVDLLAAGYDFVVRFQGGNNAGHTVKVRDETFKFNLLPSGAVQGRPVVIGNGVVVDPRVLLQEMENLAKRGRRLRLFLSERAHIILPYHLLLDAAAEEHGGKKIGTTRRGIGPCYADKAARLGIRVGEFVHEARFRRRLEEVYPTKRQHLEAAGNREIPSIDSILKEYTPLGARLAPYVRDTGEMLAAALERGKSVLYEGAQGLLLDVEHGTYPYVTSSSTVAGNATVGSGVPARHLGPVLGVAKAYCTRVGEGPFPTELTTAEATGRHILETGREFGTVTGRPRRVGWIDLVALRYAIRTGGITHLAITKLDVLTGLDQVQACVAYRRGGRRDRTFPMHADDLADARPVYRPFGGWKDLVRGSGSRARLDPRAKAFLRFLEKELQVPVLYASVGPARHETLTLRRGPFGRRGA